MKITRRQLRRIISEALDGSDNQQEAAAYAIIYAKAYVSKFAEYFSRAVQDRKFSTTQNLPPAILMMEAIDNLEAILAAGMRDFKRGNSMGDTSAERMNPVLANLPEENSIIKEAEQAAQNDFRDYVYTCVEQIDILINRQTPVGMSAVEALGVFGAEGGGIPFKNTAASDARAITSLMDNDKVLTMLDNLVEMLPELNVMN